MKKIHYLTILLLIFLSNDIIKIDKNILEDNPDQKSFNFDLSKLEDKPKNNYLFLIIEDVMSFNIRIYNEKKKTNLVFLENFVNYSKNLYIPIDDIHLKDSIVLKFDIINKNSSSNFKFNYKEYIDIPIREEVKFISKFINKINFKVNYNETKDWKKIQFYIESSVVNQKNINKNSYLNLLINKKNVFPTQNDHEMIANGIFEDGLVKTIRKDDYNFCFMNCNYFGAVDYNKIDSLSIYINTITYPQNFLIENKNLEFIEEILPNEKLTYKFDMKNFKDFNYNFSLQSYLGDADLYISVNEDPKELKNYKWKSNTNFNEDIYITKEEINKLGDLENFYVTVYSKQESTFKLKFKCLETIKNKHIKLENIYSGKLLNKEIVNFNLLFNNKNPEHLQLLFELKSEIGNCDIIVKECLEDEEYCEVTIDDIENRENLKEKENRIFLYQEKVGSDSILLNFNCISKDIKNIFNNQYKSSNSCKFVIGIYGKDDKINKENSYSLLVSGYQNHFLINPNEKTNFEIDENKQIYLKYSIPENKKKTIKSLIFNFYSTIGKSIIYYSRINQYPNKFDNLQNLNFDGNKNKITVSQKQIILTDYDIYFKGNFYFSIEAKTYSNVIVLPIINYEENDIEQLKDSKIVNVNFKKEFKNFYLETNLKEDIKTNINISLKPIIGKFKLCIQMNRKIYDPKLKCDIEEFDDFLEIKNNDKNFLKKGEYSITVIDLEYKNNPNKEKYFDIIFYYSNNLKSLEVNIPGKTFFNKINNENDLYYKINVKMAKIRIILVFDSIYDDIFVYGSRNIIQPNKKNADFKLSSNENTIVLHYDYFKKDLKTDYIYLKITSQNTVKKKFNLSYTIDEYPFILYDSKSQLSFIPVNNQFNVSYKYQIEKEYDLSLSFTNFKHFVNLVIIIKSNSNKEEEKFEIKDSKSDEITIPKEKFSRLDNPVVIINLNLNNENNNDLKHSQFEKFTLYYKNDLTILEVTNKISELKPYQIKEKRARKGTYKYFYIEFDEEVDYFLVALVSKIGETDLYIQEGKYNFPSNYNYYKKQEGFKENEIKITKEEFEKKNKKMSKLWTVGIYSKTDTKFLIILLKNKNYSIAFPNYIYDFNLKGNTDFFLNYYNNYNNNFKVYYWSKNSDIEFSYDILNENKGQNVLENTDDKDFKILGEYKLGNPPKIDVIKNDKNSNYILDFKNTSKDPTKLIVIIIDDKNDKIDLSSNKLYEYVSNKDEEKIFVINFNQYLNKFKIKLEVEFGNIELIHEKNLDILNNRKFDTAPKKFILKSKQNKEFNLNLDKDIKKASNYEIFNKYYVKIKFNEYSKFTILSKNEDSFISLNEGIPLNYKTSKDEIWYFYFDNEVEGNNLLNLEIKHHKDNKLNYEFKFLKDYNDFKFKDTMFLPINISNFKQSNLGLITKLKTEVYSSKGGIYLIKINKSKEIFDFQVKISFERKFNMKLNSYLMGSVKYNSEREYNINVPFAGKLKIYNLSCQRNVELKGFILNGNAELIDEQNYNYQYKDLENYDFTKSLIKIQNKFWNILYYDIKEPTTININIEDMGKNEEIKGQVDSDFTIINEFKPNSQKLFLKEYFDENNMDTKVYKNDDHLNLKFKIFKVKDQFSIDFKFIDEIQISLEIFVLDTESLFKFQKCGFVKNYNENEKLNNYKYNITTVLKKEEDFKNETIFDIKLNYKEHNIKTNETLEIYIIAHSYLVENNDINFLQSQYVSFPILYYSLKQKNFIIVSKISYFVIFIIVLVIFFLIYKYLKKREEIRTIRLKKDGGVINKSRNLFSKINRVEMSIKD